MGTVAVGYERINELNIGMIIVNHLLIKIIPMDPSTFLGSVWGMI